MAALSGTARPGDRIGAAEVVVELDGLDYTLRPTLRAAYAVSDRFDGFMGAYARIHAFDLSAMAFIVAAGLGKREPASVEEVRALVARSGTHGLVGPLTRFVECLANGGREPKPVAEPDEEPEPGKP